eukprot:10367348-Heterocapsa_arctica.AAC.1
MHTREAVVRRVRSRTRSCCPRPGSHRSPQRSGPACRAQAAAPGSRASPAAASQRRTGALWPS